MMLTPFLLKQTEESPLISLDKQKEIFLIKGMSMVENPAEFFQPVFDWFRHYVQEPNPQTVFTLELSYINSMTIKQLFHLLMLFKNSSVKNFSVLWRYSENDSLLKEKGEEFKMLTNLDFQFEII